MTTGENALGLPFRLRARKERSLSGEAADRIRTLATIPSLLAHVDPSKLCVVLRKFDSSGGYGLLDRRAFGLAMHELGLAQNDLFSTLDVSKTGRCDAEIVVALCRYWREQQQQPQQRENEDDDDLSEKSDTVLAERLASTPVRRACARLDADDKGRVSREELEFALADAGIPASNDSLNRYLVDGTFSYDRVGKRNPRDLGEAGEAYWTIRDDLPANDDDTTDTAVFFDELGKKMVLSATDRATLWQDISPSPSSRVAIDTLDQYFAPWKPFRRSLSQKSTENARVRQPAPFAEDDLHPPIEYPKRVLRRAPRSVGDESSVILLPKAHQQVLDDIAEARAQRSESSHIPPHPPPYWTVDSVVPEDKKDRSLLPPEPPHRPYHTDEDEDDALATSDLPSLARKLRSAVVTTTDPRVVRFALRATGEDASRGSLQSLAQYLGVGFKNGELEQLCRWVDTRPYTPFPVSNLLDLEDSLPPTRCSTSQQTDDEPVCAAPHASSSSLEEREEEPIAESSSPSSSEEEEEEPIEEEEGKEEDERSIPEKDAATAREPESCLVLYDDADEEEEPEPPPPPPMPRPEPTDEDARNSLADKLASTPALASRKACALRLRHAFRRRAAKSYSSPLVMTARGGELQTSDPVLSTPEDVASALRDLGVDISSHELRVLIADVRREQQAMKKEENEDCSSCRLHPSSDAYAEIPVGAVLARLVSLSRLRHLRTTSTAENCL